MKRILIFFLLVTLIVLKMNIEIASGQTAKQQGTIEGIVLDAETKTPLIGTNVMVVGTVFGAATGLDGRFVIRNVPAGNYVLQFDFIGY